MQDSQQELLSSDISLINSMKEKYINVRREISKAIVGQDTVIEQLLIAIFSQGHCILEGVPGLAKTMMISTLSKTMNMGFNRIQFTPDLMPTDITGTEIVQEDKSTGERLFRFIQGPIFANIVLADEINRTPPKTQSALLEAMAEKQVTVSGKRYSLPKPFFVLATQNPIEQEGTYPLPEAQQDRFMFKVFVKYPSFDEEFQIALSTTGNQEIDINTVINTDEMIEYQKLIRKVPVAGHVIKYALNLVRETRIEETRFKFIKDWLSWGAGPRAVQYLLLGAKARAALDGRHFATTDDVKAIAVPILRHRIVTNFNAEAEGITTDFVVEKLLSEIDPINPGDGNREADNVLVV